MKEFEEAEESAQEDLNEALQLDPTLQVNMLTLRKAERDLKMVQDDHRRAQNKQSMAEFHLNSAQEYVERRSRKDTDADGEGFQATMNSKKYQEKAETTHEEMENCIMQRDMARIAKKEAKNALDDKIAEEIAARIASRQAAATSEQKNSLKAANKSVEEFESAVNQEKSSMVASPRKTTGVLFQ